MKRKAAKLTRKVKVLTDPHPSFVSLVQAGANGTPIAIIKMDDPNQEAEMPKKLKTGNVDIARLVFSGDKFKTEEDVRAWLDAGGYTDAKIKAEEDGTFYVKGDDTITASAEVEVEPGIVAHVGESAKEVGDDANGDVTAVEGQKTEAPKTGAQKDETLLGSSRHESTIALTAAKSVALGDVVARAFKDSTLTVEEWNSLKDATREKLIDAAVDAMKAEAEAEGSNPVQPVATGEATKTEGQDGDGLEIDTTPEPPSETLPALLQKDENGVVRVVTQKGCYELKQLAEVIQALAWLKQDMDYQAHANGQPSSEAANALRANIRSLGETMIAVAEATVEQAAKSDNAPEDAAKEAAGEGQETPSAVAPAEGTSDAAKTEGSTPDLTALLTAIAGLTDTVKGLSDAVKAVQKSSEQNADMASKLNERLERVEKTSQSRKSADVEELATSNPQSVPKQKTASEEARDINARNILGLR